MSDDNNKNNNENMNNDENRRPDGAAYPKSKRFEKKRQRNGGRIFVIIFILFIIISSVAYVFIDKYLPNFEQIPLYKFFTDLEEDKIYIVLGDERLEVENHPVVKDGTIYIPVDFVKEHIDKYIFWDETVERLTITTENKVIQMKTEDLAYYINAEPFNLSFPVYNIDGVAYIPGSMLTDLYDITLDYNEEYNQTIIDYVTEERQLSKVTSKSASMRYDPDIKSPIQERLPLDTLVYSYDETEEFTKVRTYSGLIGYVRTSDIAFEETIPPEIKADISDKPAEYKPIEGNINIIWDQIYSFEASANTDNMIEHDSIDVISPTWFSFDEEKLNGDITHIADKAYVEAAHEKGYQVWGLITDNFSYKVSHAVLSDTNIREYVVKQLLAFVSMYDMDGINIDFENIGEDDADFFVQFLRELYPLLKEQGVILSVDLKVPLYTKYLDRTEIANACDYVIIMGYDEHYSTSPVSGSVASIGFVEDGVFETLKETPPEKTVLALPYYVRVWREVMMENETKVKSKAYSKSDAIALFEANGAEWEWLETPANHYAEYITEEEGESVKYRVWLEDERSLEEKIKIAQKYNLAGIAGWSSYWIQGEAEESFLDLVRKYTKENAWIAKR